MGLRSEAGRGTLSPALLGVNSQYQWKDSLVYAIMRLQYLADWRICHEQMETNV